MERDGPTQTTAIAAKHGTSLSGPVMTLKDLDLRRSAWLPEVHAQVRRPLRHKTKHPNAISTGIALMARNAAQGNARRSQVAQWTAIVRLITHATAANARQTLNAIPTATARTATNAISPLTNV